MNQIVALLRMILFFISNIGYWEWLRKKSKINAFFVPGLVIVSQITILFLAGLLNCLKITTLILFVAGLIFALYYLVTEKRQFVSAYMNEGFLFLFCAVFLCLFALRGKIFTSYDNFSHWALVVRNMLQTNRFPNFDDTLITFQSYPLGSSVYIYYFSKLISRSESIQMLAQCYMMLCFILPIFKNAKKYRIFNFVALTIFVNFIFNYNTSITDLLVDTLLPLEGMAAILFVFSECINKVDGAEKRVSILYAIPFLCTALQIKNSGVFFVAVACIIIITAAFKYQLNIRNSIVTCLSPFISLYLWKAHCAYVFPLSETTKHAMSVSNYRQVFEDKTPEDISIIVREFRSFIFQGKELYFLLAFLSAITLIVLFTKQNMKKLIELWCVCVSIYITYMLGMFFMYLFSMPGGEATSLASAERYRRTILIALYYMIIRFFIEMVSEIETKKTGWIVSIIAILMLVVTWRGERGSFITIFSPAIAESPDERLWVENAIAKYDVLPQKSYIMCIPGADNGYAYYLCQYILYSPHVSLRVITEENQLDDVAGYDYVFLYDRENEMINDWVSKKYPDQIDREVIVVEK